MKNYSSMLLLVGLLGVAVGVMLPIMSGNPGGEVFKWVYAGGALLTLLARLFQPSPGAGTPLRVKRLLRLESWSALLFCVAAFFAFYSAPVLRDWLAFTLAGAAIQVYCSIALGMAGRRRKQK